MFRVHTPETCQAKETAINYIVASSWQFTLFHDEDARSNNPQITSTITHPLTHYVLTKLYMEPTIYFQYILLQCMTNVKICKVFCMQKIAGE